jgi:hypothetical protein
MAQADVPFEPRHATLREHITNQAKTLAAAELRVKVVGANCDDAARVLPSVLQDDKRVIQLGGALLRSVG